MLTDAVYNAMLDNAIPSGAAQTMISAHTDYSATGANVHGSKVASNFGGAASRQKALSAAVSLTIAAATTVKWLGVWDAAGTTFKGMVPNGGVDFSFQVDLTNNKIVAEGTSYANGDKITFHNGTAPGGLTAGTTYFVVGFTAGDPDSFQVAATAGGAAIDLTSQAAAECFVSKILEETYAAGGTHQVNTLTINI